MQDCLFCKIISGEIPSKKLYEDELVYAFADINPQASTHALVAPKQHVTDLHAGARELPADTLAALLTACDRVAQELGLWPRGYRVVSNNGPYARQSVAHLHFHVMGGEELSERMA